MPLLRVFDTRHDRLDAIAGQVRALTRFDVLEAENAPEGQIVRDIIAQVRASGDQALCALARRLYNLDLTPDQLRIDPAEAAEAARNLDGGLRRAIQTAIDNVRWFQEQILVRADRTCERAGIRIDLRSWPLRRVGVYVPAGSFPLPSSLIHCAVPAQAAGVTDIVLCSPPRSGRLDPTILATAHMLGIREIYNLGGAQAVAGMALGTQTIRPVDKIVGPGSIYTQLAKKMLYGVVDIDSFAGPSEVLVIADGDARAEFVAADLLAQAEHNPGQAVLATPSAELLAAVERALEGHLVTLATAEQARKCLADYAAAVLVCDLDEAARFAEAYAPEHLQIETREPERLAAAIASAGAVFLGHFTPESLGDYVAGPSHVLPTGGTARFFSGLSVYDFLRRGAWLRYDEKALGAEGPDTACLAEAEGLAAHALAVRVRTPAAHRPH